MAEQDRRSLRDRALSARNARVLADEEKAARVRADEAKARKDQTTYLEGMLKGKLGLVTVTLDWVGRSELSGDSVRAALVDGVPLVVRSTATGTNRMSVLMEGPGGGVREYAFSSLEDLGVLLDSPDHRVVGGLRTNEDLVARVSATL